MGVEVTNRHKSSLTKHKVYSFAEDDLGKIELFVETKVDELEYGKSR